MRFLLLFLVAWCLNGCGEGAPAAPSIPQAGGLAKHAGRVLAAPLPATKIEAYRDWYKVAVSGTAVSLTNTSTGATQTFGTAQELHFFDKAISFDIAGQAGQAYRIYQAAFNRKPDPTGLGFWIHSMRNGASLDSVSLSFQGSAEFKAMYGENVSADQWITLVYNNVLKREPDAAGKKWWVEQLNAGADRAAALAGFSESAENKQNLAADYANGIEYAVYGGPLAPKMSSYENKNDIAGVDTAFPGVWDRSMTRVQQAMSVEEQGFNARSLSFADFSGRGSFEAFVTSTRYQNLYPVDNKSQFPDSPSKSYFLRKNIDGKWDDITSDLLEPSDNRLTCVTTSYSLIADFNNDGKPDVYLACTGLDFQVNATWTSEQKIYESEQHLYLSQANGRYKHVTLPFGKIYGHQATAFDIDGDRNVDIVTVDPNINRIPFVLWGNGDGAFRVDKTRMPSDMENKAIFGVLALPIDGKMSLVVSGVTPGDAPISYDAYGTKLLRYENGMFTYVTDLTATVPNTPAGFKFGLALDHLYKDGRLYSYHVSASYDYDGVIRRDLRSGTAELIYSKKITGFGQQLVLIFMNAARKITLFGAMCVESSTPPPVCSLQVDS